MIKANVPMVIESMNLTKDKHGRNAAGTVRLCGISEPVEVEGQIAEHLWRDPYERAPMRLIVLAGSEAKVADELTARAEKAEREASLDRSMCLTLARMSDEDKAAAKKAKNDLESAERDLNDLYRERHDIGRLVGCPQKGVELKDHVDQVMVGFRTQLRLASDECANQRNRAESAELKVAMLEAEVEIAHKANLARQQRAKKLFGAKLHESWHEAAERFKREALAMEHGRAKEADRLRMRLAGQGAPSSARLLDLAEAREQLAKVEWAGKTEYVLLPECPLCKGIQPSDAATRYVVEACIGHRPTCWHARQGINEENPQCPTQRVRWQDQNRTRRAVGDSTPDQTADPPRKPASEGVSESATREETELPGNKNTLCGMPMTYLCLARVPPSHPAPKFKVGQKVWADGKTYTIARSLWHALFSFWSHKMESGETISDHQLKPAPRFAVGEWVTINGGGRYGEVTKRDYSADITGQWQYDVDTKTNITHCPESLLTAQTPQYKHDCKGCVFLGRMTYTNDTGRDLWFVPNGPDPINGPSLMSFDGSERRFIAAAGRSLAPCLIEARRRAVARGLVKG